MAPTVPQELLWADHTSLAFVHWRVEQGDIPSRRELGGILEANIDEKLPRWFLELVSAELQGKLKRKRGRRPQSEWREELVGWAKSDYWKLHWWLQRRQRSQGLRGWSRIRKAPWWQGPPGERAARMVQTRYQRKFNEFVMIDLRRFRNLLSPSRKRRELS
jgi:hypothetical protein